MSPPPSADPLPFSARVSDVRVAHGRVTFVASFDNRAPDQWTGQDWVLIDVDDSPWDLPRGFLDDKITPLTRCVVHGWLGPGSQLTTHTYEFDAKAISLAVQGDNGVFTAVASSGRIESAGSWVLAVRLRHEWQPNYWRDVAYIPILKVTTSAGGELSYQVYDDPLTIRPP